MSVLFHVIVWCFLAISPNEAARILGIRPVPPTVVYMGGLHQKPDKELPSDLKSYLDSSQNGSDLLKHPKIKLFITQGGLQSTDEAITAGVPLIGMPMLGDQWFNVERYEYHKIGIRIDMKILTAEKLIKAINTVIGDDSYRRNTTLIKDKDNFKVYQQIKTLEIDFRLQYNLT
ncbi:unnamed protein product [Arctia plantaginis]|uniref:Glucuronosyltransferase n=1 Tax=Arctia plantaginis TaxID=874455 RepID=A0A8S1AGQ5_ARCPL|nr:unnamed protein product [Arctia plantaginis]